MAGCKPEIWGESNKTGHLKLAGPEEKHDCHRRRQKYLSRRYRTAFEGLPIKEFCIFATNYIWPERTMVGEELLIVVRPEQNRPMDDALRAELSLRNAKLLNYKRISAYVIWGSRFSAHCLHESEAHRSGAANSGETESCYGAGSSMKKEMLAIVNRAAGGGRAGNLQHRRWIASALRELPWTQKIHPALATRRGLHVRLTRKIYRNFISVGGDGTGFEIVNGIFPEALNTMDRVALGFLPLGTEIRFSAIQQEWIATCDEALLAGKRRRCDVLKLTHATGVIYYINLLSVGFTADVTALANRRFKTPRRGRLRSCRTRQLDAFAPACFSASFGFHRGIRYQSLPFSDLQQQQIHRWKNDDRAEGRIRQRLIEYVRWGAIGRLRC